MEKLRIPQFFKDSTRLPRFVMASTALMGSTIIYGLEYTTVFPEQIRFAQYHVADGLAAPIMAEFYHALGGKEASRALNATLGLATGLYFEIFTSKVHDFGDFASIALCGLAWGIAGPIGEKAKQGIKQKLVKKRKTYSDFDYRS